MAGRDRGIGTLIEAVLMKNSEIGEFSSLGPSQEIHTLTRWILEGRQVALATVTQTWRSSPRPAGSHLVIDSESNFEGSVSGGCIEAAVITEALEVIQQQRPRVLEYGVSDDSAWAVGLSCGGAIQVFVEPITE